MTHAVDDARLMAYLDGQLSEVEALAVEQALAASPELREREAELRQLLGDLVFDFAQLDALDAKALTRIAAANALPSRNPSDITESHGGVNGSSGPPDPLSFAAPSPSLDHSIPVSQRWTRKMGWLAAAGFLVAVGAGGGFWLAQAGRIGFGGQLATGRGAGSVLDNDTRESSRQASDRSVAMRSGQRGQTATEPRRSPSPASPASTQLTQPPESLPEGLPPAAVPANVSILLAGSKPVGGRETSTNEPGGVRSFVVDGVRISVVYGNAVPDSLAVLNGSGLTRLRDRASAAGTSAAGARALNDGTIAPRDSLCLAGLRFIDGATGLPLSIRGPASCSLLARLALQVEVQRSP